MLKLKSVERGNHWTHIGKAKILEPPTLVPCKAQCRRPHGRNMGCALGNRVGWHRWIPVGKLLLPLSIVYVSVDFVSRFLTACR